MPTPTLSLPTITTAQAQKEVTHNDALNDLDMLVMPRVIDRNLTTPPTSPAEGDSYIVATGATGAWAGHDNKLAAYYSGWKFKTPRTGWAVYVTAEARPVIYTGSAWVFPTVQGAGGGTVDSAGTNTPHIKIASSFNCIAVGQPPSAMTNGISYIGFNAVRTASNTWNFATDGTRNGGAIIDARTEGGLRVYIRASTGATAVTDTDTNVNNTQRMQVQDALIAMGGAIGGESLRVVRPGSMVNRMEVLGSATGSAVIMRSAGSDTNIDLQIQPQGTGRVRFQLDATNAVTTVGAAGGGTALPTTPVGYMRININGTIRKIPYYND